MYAAIQAVIWIENIKSKVIYLRPKVLHVWPKVIYVRLKVIYVRRKFYVCGEKLYVRHPKLYVRPEKLCARSELYKRGSHSICAALWQSVCTSIHTRAHTSPTTSMCSNLGLPSNLKPHKFLIYVCSAQRINISKKIQLFRGISSSRSSRQLADGCVCARTHITHAHSAHELLVV